jgi:hypothetical protein
VAERMHPEDLALLADLVAERLVQRLDPQASPAPSPMGGLVTAAVLAERLGVTADTVRAHADALGAVRIGEGPRPRLRFDLELALTAWSARAARRGSSDSEGRADPVPPLTKEASVRRRRAPRSGNGLADVPARALQPRPLQPSGAATRQSPAPGDEG